MVLQKVALYVPQVAWTLLVFPLQRVAEAGSDSQDRCLSRKPQAWVWLTWFLLKLYSAPVLIFLLLLCDYPICTDDHKKGNHFTRVGHQGPVVAKKARHELWREQGSL